MSRDQDVGHDDTSEGKAMAEHIWRLTVDLSGDNSSRVTDRLLDTDGRSPAVLGCHVDIEPRKVQASTVVDSNGAYKGGKVLDRVVTDGDEKDVSDSSQRVCEENELERFRVKTLLEYIGGNLQGRTFGTCRTGMRR